MENKHTTESSIIYGVYYFPKLESLNRDIAQPHPDYSGWTLRRMGKDMKRISKTGIDLIIIRVFPEDFEDRVYRSKLMSFIQLTGDFTAGPKIVFELECAGLKSSGFNGLLNTIALLDLYRYQGYHRRERKPLFLLQNSAHLGSTTHPGLSLEHIMWKSDDEDKRRGRGLEETEISEDGTIVLIYCGLASYDEKSGKIDWILKRKNGRTMKHHLRAARLLAPRMIMIASWNNYEDGSFIEPNLSDGSRVYNALRKELAR